VSTTGKLQTLYEGGYFFESPRWNGGRWWVSDMFDNRVLALTPLGSVSVEHRFDDHPSGLGWLPDGRLLVVLMNARTVVAVDGLGNVTDYADLTVFGSGPANDMIVDSDGYAWVGYLGFDMAAGQAPQLTTMVRVAPDRTVTPAINGLLTPNGSVLLSDRRTLVIAETFASRLTSVQIADDGSLLDRAVFAQLATPPPLTDLRSCLRALRVAPDGLAVNSEDCVWYADAAGGGCVLVAAGGQVLDTIEAPPGLQVFACALGGPTNDTLLLCCAPDAIEYRRRQAPGSVLITTRVETPAPP